MNDVLVKSMSNQATLGATRSQQDRVSVNIAKAENGYIILANGYRDGEFFDKSWIASRDELLDIVDQAVGK